jgi:hypothetical protein
LRPTNLRTKLYCNLENTSLDKHMPPAHLRAIQLRVLHSRKQLTIQEISVGGNAPVSIGQLNECCEAMSLELHLKRHNDPLDEYCLDLHATYVLGHDIKDMWVMTNFSISSPFCHSRTGPVGGSHQQRSGAAKSSQMV